MGFRLPGIVNAKQILQQVRKGAEAKMLKKSSGLIIQWVVSQSPAQKKPLLILLVVGTAHERGRSYANG
ncbi:hypothetical protein CK203_022279 [Vitis vinifera]|uniref:Uncharacterized protein n=1 Tax=Vitis vinifera TaxID=29760 RepID=A0A438I928_VITVI|nr:hypothetical protein CK203_022279 [Vitis vinifera]